jgi:hypothetical protein
VDEQRRTGGRPAAARACAQGLLWHHGRPQQELDRLHLVPRAQARDALVAGQRLVLRPRRRRRRAVHLGAARARPAGRAAAVRGHRQPAGTDNLIFIRPPHPLHTRDFGCACRRTRTRPSRTTRSTRSRTGCTTCSRCRTAR